MLVTLLTPDTRDDFEIEEDADLARVMWRLRQLWRQAQGVGVNDIYCRVIAPGRYEAWEGQEAPDCMAFVAEGSTPGEACANLIRHMADEGLLCPS